VHPIKFVLIYYELDRRETVIQSKMTRKNQATTKNKAANQDPWIQICMYNRHLRVLILVIQKLYRQVSMNCCFAKIVAVMLLAVGRKDRTLVQTIPTVAVTALAISLTPSPRQDSIYSNSSQEKICLLQFPTLPNCAVLPRVSYKCARITVI
jgi:hypothetical protein